MKKDQMIIIKKVKKREHEAHHGGAWKVAYADFVTAMMAFFIVLWLIAMLSIQTREAVAVYFRSYTIFKGSAAGGAKGISLMKGNPVKLENEASETQSGKDASKEIDIDLSTVIEQRLQDFKDQVLVFTTTDGVRIEVVDKVGQPMFDAGGAILKKDGDNILRMVAVALKDIDSEIAIEGHTDKYSLGKDEYTNWELAADRANAARRALIGHDIGDNKIKQVTSFADINPINPDNPYDPMNRRVSILVMKKDMSK
ncbi:MAG: OmpA family protein [Deltaproteobacteria bacterium]|nr:OmpA family protein [Deltaproteobacteria bacterium]